MFKVGKEYKTENGNTALIIADNSPYMSAGRPCPIVAAMKSPGGIYNVHLAYDIHGNYCGLPDDNFKHYRMISDEPNEEEQRLIDEIIDLSEGPISDNRTSLLNIIRQLRK